MFTFPNKSDYMKIVECVPNFSEGKRQEVIDAIVNKIESVEDIKVLDKEMDADHNRAVITFIGTPNAVKKSAFLAIKKAMELINMEKHKGEHPRIGATDVVPFVPISGVTMKDCVKIANELGKEIGEKLKIPVYLYEEAATRLERKNLANIRKGEYEGLKKEIKTNEERKPDYGPSKMHPTAGAIAIGARMPLIAFNVNLGTNNVKIAKNIANAIRFKNGGLRYIKAMGFEIKKRGIVQVSMNLTNYKKTPVFRVFEMIRREAERYGVNVIGSEVIGLIPMDAVIDCFEYYLRVEDFKKNQVLEKRIQGDKNG